MTKRLVAMAVALACATLGAETKTWVGGAAGEWQEDAHWEPSGVPAATDDVVITGAVEVTWSSGDWSPNATVTVAAGAKLVQTNTGWQNFGEAAALVLDGGTYDAGPSANFRLNAARLTVRNGGALVAASARLTRDEDSILSIAGGTVTFGGDLTLQAGDSLASGALSADEVTVTADLALTDFSLACTTLNVNNMPVLSLKGSSLRTARTKGGAAAGIWGRCTVNFVPGAVSSFSALTVTGAYADTFATENFVSNYSRLDAEAFAAAFETDETSEEGRFTISSKAVPGAPDITAVAAAYAEGAIAFTVKLAAEAGAEEGVCVYYDTADHAHDSAAAWPNAVPLALTDAAGVYTADVEVANGRYYYLVAATNDALSVWSPGSVIAADLPADANVWLGTTADIADPSNWSRGTVPGKDDIVEINPYFSSAKSLTWDVATIPEIAGWRQTADRLVYISGTAERALVVTGDVSITAGTWTHPGPSDEPTACVNVRVGGSFSLGSAARIVAGTAVNADETDGRSRGYTRGNGPGFLSNAYGAAHGGDGGTNPTEGSAPAFVSYGSVLDPLSHGSGGYGDGTSYAGGGVIVLSVAGALNVDGTICARGFGYPLSNAYAGGAGSGGSVNLTAGSLSGTGTIDANGGNNGYRGPGSGGRVKVALTSAAANFESFTGVLSAFGGSVESRDSQALQDTSPAAAGTVALLAGNARRVIVDNILRQGSGGEMVEWYVQTNAAPFVAGTHLPAMGLSSAERAALRKTSWVLKRHGTVRLTEDFRLASLDLASSSGDNKILTDGHKLTVGQLVIAGIRRHGTFTAENLPEVVVGTGSVQAGGSFAISIR